MKYLFSLLLLNLFCTSLLSQSRIDGSFAFESDPAKKYSIYIPSGYDASKPHQLMLGLHPLNTNRWDAESWCDTLIAFAEMNNLLLVCPDGGLDGAVDDPIDIGFTTALLDSMETWYNIDLNKVYAMGFSWGGKTTYTYGLNNVGRIAGFMPIGAAINISEVQSSISNAVDKPFYLVHGGNDNPNIRFYPLKNALEENQACVESNLMPGVGHTIDFPNRNQILSDAFNWIQDNSCVTLGVNQEDINEQIFLFPNPAKIGQTIIIEGLTDQAEISIYDLGGKLIQKSKSSEVSLSESGIYYLRISMAGKMISKKIIIK